jgi:putative ABC transport system permease protein
MKQPGINPPSWVEGLLRLALDDEVAESVIGDLTEKFRVRTENGQRGMASLLYVVEGLGLLRLMGYSKKLQKKSTSTNHMEMIGNYFLFAWRNLKKEKVYSAMSVTGMAVGLASVLVIYSYITFELSYDTFHPNHDKVFRLTSEFDDDGMRKASARVEGRIYKLLTADNIAGIQTATRILTLGGHVSADPQLKVRGVFCYADTSFFTVFPFEAIEGSLRNALQAPYSIVITESIANRHFGKTNVVGQQMLFESEVSGSSYNITAVIKDFPQNSHFNAEYIASFESLKDHPYFNNDGQYPPLFIYAQMKDVTPAGAVHDKLQAAIAKHQPPFMKERNIVYNVQALGDIHLYSHLESEWEANSMAIYIQAFAMLASFILFIACINFINLATAQTMKRAREIGVRKVFGGLKVQLILQFLTETFAHVVIAFILAIGLAEITLRFVLSGIIEKELTVVGLLNMQTVLIAIGLILLVSLLSGLYPSIYLSRLRPVVVLKGLAVKQGGDYLRKTLVTVQVVISCLLVTGTIIILKQVEYFKTSDLGFDKEQILAVALTDRTSQTNWPVFNEMLKGESAVISTALSSTLMGRKAQFYGFFIVPEGMTEEQQMNIKTLGCDEGLVDTYNLRLIEGRNFSRDIGTDQTEAFIINEAAAKMLGWEHPVGKELQLTVYTGGRVVRKGKVIGLVSDFHFESLHFKVDPLLLYINKHPYYSDFISVRLKPGYLTESVERIRELWSDFQPDRPMEYSFIDEDLDRLYQSETKFSSILSIISVVAIFISALGVFALSSYMASRRARELSIRKVFGASTIGLLILQYRQYFALVLLANLISIPVCTFAARQWLDSIPNHIALDTGIFVLTFVGSIAVTLLIITFHTSRVANANPVNVIRNE